MATLSDRNIPYTTTSYVPNPQEPSLWKGVSATAVAAGETYLDRRISAVATTEVNDIASTLKQRGDRYGKFTGHAKITQSLKSVMRNTGNWAKLSDDQKESLEMVAHKIGRILNGDPDYDDSWVDIAGYSKLVGDRLTSGTEV